MRLTARSTKRTAFSAPPSGEKTGAASSPSPIFQKKPAAQVHLLIKMVLSPPRLCSAGTMRIQAIKDCAGRRIDAFEVLSIDKE